MGPVLKTLHEFIQTLPVVSSHYTLAKAPLRQYLPAGGSISGLFYEYEVWMQVNYNNVVPVKEAFFHKVFTMFYNIQFAPPKTDKCNVCACWMS